MAEKPQMLVINGHDYTAYIKQKTGFKWSRENTNDEKAGRDTAETMHTNVTSHQRKIEIKMGPIPWDMAQQLEADLQGGDSGIEVSYPDLKDGFCKRLFYNTSVDAALERIDSETGTIFLDDLSFSLISVKEDLI